MEYPITDIIDRARHGRKAVYPNATEVGRFSITGARVKANPTRFPTMDDILLLPPQFTPLRLKKSIELIYREPVFYDVETKCSIGGFTASLPLVQASMGSPEMWNRLAPFSAKACAAQGLIYGIGENVASTWGYGTRKHASQPTLKERILEYFNWYDGLGGVVIQQNEEDAANELWNKIYSDPDFDQWIQEGKIAFEIKGGQGAKAGMGGEKMVDRQTALDLKDIYYIHPDPETVVAQSYERHSAPDIFTQEILANRIRKLRNDYPRIKIWMKTGPYRDLAEVVDVVRTAGADCLTIDGKEGGTGLSPSVALHHVGLPTLTCAGIAASMKRKNPKMSIVLSGRMRSGADIVKCSALGLDGISMGRPFLIAGYSFKFSEYFMTKGLYRNSILSKLAQRLKKPSEKSVGYITNFVESVRTETMLLTAALGKYDIHHVDRTDVGTFNPSVARMFGISDLNEVAFEQYRRLTPAVHA